MIPDEFDEVSIEDEVNEVAIDTELKLKDIDLHKLLRNSGNLHENARKLEKKKEICEKKIPNPALIPC